MQVDPKTHHPAVDVSYPASNRLLDARVLPRTTASRNMSVADLDAGSAAFQRLWTTINTTRSNQTSYEQWARWWAT